MKGPPTVTCGTSFSDAPRRCLSAAFMNRNAPTKAARKDAGACMSGLAFMRTSMPDKRRERHLLVVLDVGEHAHQRVDASGQDVIHLAHDADADW